MSTAQRTFAHRRILRIGQDELTGGIQMLGHQVLDRLGWPDAVIGIAHGGLPPARLLAAALNSPLYQVTAQHNLTNDTYLQATGEVRVDVQPLGQALAGRRPGGLILLVDDICGTGATLAAVKAALRPLLSDGATVATAVLCLNEGSAVQPDMWLWTVDDWVWFPWEPEPAAQIPVELLTVARQVQP